VQRERDITEQARLRELQAAALASYAPEQAKPLLQQVMRDWPLSLPALFAAERLRALAAALPPPPIDDSTPPAPLVLALPPKAALYQRIGFDELAAEALAGDERGLSKQYEPRGTEAVCGLYGLLAVAEQRYRWGRNKLLPSAFVEHPRASNRWAWECVYPRPYAPLVADLAQRFSLDPSLLYAVMRRESAFRIDAVSSVGARGLMQLMPATARRVAQDAALPEPAGLLSSPARNVELGARYLQVLARIFAGTAPLMIASYNAGPKAVSQWLEHGEALPLDVWVARIPYRETRHYVLHVMTNWLRYRELAGENLPALALELPQGLRAPADAY
jgi:soluble lytic murein transglycosylase